MRRLIRALAMPHVVGATIATLCVWTAASSVLAIWTQRFYHSTLDAASVVARDSIGDAGTTRVLEQLPGLQKHFNEWRVVAAAFDREGKFIAGDARVSNDGLPVGNEPAPDNGRQVAIVPTRDGYVLLVPDPQAVRQISIDVVGWLILTLIVVGLAAFGFGGVWAIERARSVARLRDGLRAVAEGSPTLPPQNDPLYGEVWGAAADAVARLGGEIKELSEAEEHLRSFLADAGHELRTPLAIAVGYLGILKRGGAHDPALTERITNDIAAEHERLARLVERILLLARLDALPRDPNAACDVTSIVHEAIALVKPLAPDRAIDVDAPAGAFAAIGADDLREALRNLLDNALRYAPDAAIAVSVRNGAGVTVRVADRGPGMDAFTAAHAFDRFFRGPNRGSTQGSGLGLAIVRRVVERALGRIELRSVPGEGTTMEITLPRAA